MVKRKNSSILQKSSKFTNLKKYFNKALISVFKLRPYDLENNSFGYLPPICLLSIISYICSSIASYFIFEDLSIIDLIIISLIAYIPIFIFLLISAYIYSYFGCLILELKNEAKDFGLIASSFSPFPIVFGLSFSNSSTILSLSITLTMIFMNYYVSSSYQRYCYMGDERTRIIYHAFGVAMFILTLYTLCKLCRYAVLFTVESILNKYIR